MAVSADAPVAISEPGHDRFLRPDDLEGAHVSDQERESRCRGAQVRVQSDASFYFPVSRSAAVRVLRVRP